MIGLGYSDVAMRGIVYACRQMFSEDLATAEMVLGRSGKTLRKSNTFLFDKVHHL